MPARPHYGQPSAFSVMDFAARPTEYRYTYKVFLLQGLWWKRNRSNSKKGIRRERKKVTLAHRMLV